MQLTKEQVEVYRALILEYCPTGTVTKEVRPNVDNFFSDTRTMNEYRRNGLWFIDSPTDPSIFYNNDRVVDTRGYIMKHGAWEEELYAVGEEARKLFEAEAIEAHWNYYSERGLIAEYGSLELYLPEEAIAIIREARKKSLKLEQPRLFEQDDNGEHLYLNEVLEYTQKVLSYFGDGGLVYIEREDKNRREWNYEGHGLRLRATSRGQIDIWYEGLQVFRSERMYETVPGAGDKVKRELFLYAEDYADYVSLFTPGGWEYLLSDLHDATVRRKAEIASANAKIAEDAKQQKAKEEELRAFWDDVRRYAYWYLLQTSGTGEAEDDQIRIVLDDDVVLSLYKKVYHGIRGRKVRWDQIGFYGPLRDASDEWWYPHMCELIEKAKAFANANKPDLASRRASILEEFSM